MKETMRIRVTKADEDNNWYRVGDVYEVCKKTSTDTNSGETYYPIVGSEYSGIGEEDFEVISEESSSATEQTLTGGSSSYYDLAITRKDGSVLHCSAQDIISSVLNNDFNFGNIFKAIVRVAGKNEGGGKSNTSVQYDMDKVCWFAEDYASRNK